MFKTKVINNWLNSDLHEYIVSYFSYKVPHYFGHKSAHTLPDNFNFYSNEFHDNPIINYFKFKLRKDFDNQIEFLRAYINVQHPDMDTLFHKDDGDVTILYMVCGEGDFKLIKDFDLIKKKDDQTAEIQPKEIETFKFEENKLILFDAKTPHKGEAPKKGMRITLAFKSNWVEKND